MKRITVSAAIIIRANPATGKNEVFASQRSYGEWKGWWEFPGGKLEPGETAEQCIVREIREELASQVNPREILGVVEYDYPAFHLTMHCILCSIVAGKPKLIEHTDARWLTSDILRSVEWLPADCLILDKVQDVLTNGSYRCF